MESVIGVDLGGTNIRSGRIEDYKIAEFYSQKINSDGTSNIVIAEVIHSIRSIMDKSVCGIGIGVPSLVDTERGIVYDVQNIPSWKEVNLKDILEDEFHVPVYVNNDANCFVAGEKYFGLAKNYSNIVGLIIGTGLGAGIYTNGKLYSGTNCGAGEFGMISYKDRNYEYYCSGQFFINEHKIDGFDLSQLAEFNDPKALSIFDEFGMHLGYAISAIMYSVDPEFIVLGGSVSKSFKYYKRSLFTLLDSFPYSRSIGKLKIAVSELPHPAILGAAALYYEYESRQKRR